LLSGGTIKTSSKKSKGRRLQQHTAKRILETFGLPESDVKSLPMGSQGEDVWISQKARDLFPFSIECKNVEKLNVWAAFDQAKANAGQHFPLLVHSRNRSDVLATLRFDDLLELVRRATRSQA
jgi:two-component SAPR family response regulator